MRAAGVLLTLTLDAPRLAVSALVLTGVGAIMYRQVSKTGAQTSAAPEGVPPD